MKNVVYPLVKNPFSSTDIAEGIKVLRSKQLTLGKKTLELENFFKKKFNLKYCSMVNSGSSANLLAFQTLTNPFRDKKLFKNDEVLVPALCWPTTFWPIIQSNLKPVFVDCDKNNLNIDIKDLEKKISKRTKCLILVHVLGHCANMGKIMKIVKKNKLILIEDNCESLGTKYKNKFLGTFGDFSSTSFYSSHQIAAGEGGIISCKDSKDNQIINSLRSHGWFREKIKLQNSIYKKYFKKYLDSKFTFYNSGYNLRPTEVSAAIAISQLKKIEKIKKIRIENYKKIKKMIKSDKILSKYLNLINENKNISECWLSFPIILSKKINKKKFLYNLNKLGIESRPIITGDFSQQPVFKKYAIKKDKFYSNSRYIHNYGFYIGLHSKKIENKEIMYLKKSFLNSLIQKKIL